VLIKPVKKNGFYIPLSGDPRLHEELAWFATDDGEVLGVVIRDRIDKDFSWVVLMQSDSVNGYYAVDCAASLPSQDAAKEALHVAMERARAQSNLM
jgi:hypothetical protein